MTAHERKIITALTDILATAATAYARNESNGEQYNYCDYELRDKLSSIQRKTKEVIDLFTEPFAK